MFTSVSVFFIALSLRTVKSDEPVYRAVGDEVVLKPDPVQGPITDIMWKHGQDIAIECYQGSVDGYRQFKERGSLNVTTGALTITGLTPGESGSYTAEINNKVTSTTQLLVISRVSKPTVSTQCYTDLCVFNCESNDITAEPVTYSWMAEEKLLASTKEIRIAKDESEKQFHCEVRNPVSTEMSELVHNPLSNWKWYYGVLFICSIMFIGGLIFFIGLIYVIFCKRDKIKDKWLYTVFIIGSLLSIGGLIFLTFFIVLIYVIFYISLSIIPDEVRRVTTQSFDDSLSPIFYRRVHNPAPGLEPPERSNHVPATNGPSETSRKDETILEIPPVQVHTNQTASEDTVNETEVPGASNQDPTSDAASGSRSETDIGASPDQVLTDATNEAGKLSDCLKDQGISTHNQETSALTESTNRTEESTVIPSVQDSPVQEQAADGQNQT